MSAHYNNMLSMQLNPDLQRDDFFGTLEMYLDSETLNLSFFISLTLCGHSKYP